MQRLVKHLNTTAIVYTWAAFVIIGFFTLTLGTIGALAPHVGGYVVAMILGWLPIAWLVALPFGLWDLLGGGLIAAFWWGITSAVVALPLLGLQTLIGPRKWFRATMKVVIVMLSVGQVVGAPMHFQIEGHEPFTRFVAGLMAVTIGILTLIPITALWPRTVKPEEEIIDCGYDDDEEPEVVGQEAVEEWRESLTP